MWRGIKKCRAYLVVTIGDISATKRDTDCQVCFGFAFGLLSVCLGRKVPFIGLLWSGKSGFLRSRAFHVPAGTGTGE